MHGEDRLAGREGQGGADGGARGVPAHVGERFLRDAHDGRLGVGGQRPRRTGDRERRAAVVLCSVLVHEPAQAVGQGTLVAAQRGDGRARVGEPVGGERARPPHGRAGAVGVVALELRLGQLELDRERRERVGEHVVDLACDPHALGQRRGARLLLAGALALGEAQLGLLDPQHVLAPGQAGHEPRGRDDERQRDQRPRVGDRGGDRERRRRGGGHHQGRPECELLPGDRGGQQREERGERVGAAGEPAADAHGEQRGQRGAPERPRQPSAGGEREAGQEAHAGAGRRALCDREQQNHERAEPDGPRVRQVVDHRCGDSTPPPAARHRLSGWRAGGAPPPEIARRADDPVSPRP